MRAPLPILIALTAILTGPTTVLALGVSPPEPPRVQVRAGDMITTAVPVLPPGTREFELVLLPEGGTPITLTAELPAGVTSVSWRVPRTYANRARLALRLGGASSERSATPSGWFMLAPPGEADLMHLVTIGFEECSTRESGAPVPVAMGGASGPATFADGAANPSAVETQAPPAVTLPRGERSRLQACGAPRPHPPAPKRESPEPGRIPLRN